MILTALLILACIWILAVPVAMRRRVADHTAACNAGAELYSESIRAEKLADDKRLPKVSVVAFILRDEENLSDYIDLLMGQDYPNLEVVIVCDASAEATATLSEKFENVDGLRITFIPPGSHNLSRRKLAQTVGIKAATGDIVLLSSTSVLPRSASWVSAMVADFIASPASEAMCLGYIRPDISHYEGGAKWYRQFDHMMSAICWMDAALKGRAYRGDGYNMAFRRQLFFDNKGYASTIPLMDGDDDIFVREIAGYGSVSLQLAADSILTTNWGESSNRIHIDYKDRYAFTRRFLPQAPFMREAASSWARWTALIAGAASVALAAISLLTPAAMPQWLNSLCEAILWPDEALMQVSCGALAIALLIVMAVAEIISYRRVAKALEATRLFWGIIPFLLWRPIGNLLFRINHRTSRKSHFTWQR